VSALPRPRCAVIVRRHVQPVKAARSTLRITDHGVADATPRGRVARRARPLIGSLIGLTDGQFNSETAAGQWAAGRL